MLLLLGIEKKANACCLCGENIPFSSVEAEQQMQLLMLMMMLTLMD
jgi:hypothetical protein